LPHPRACFCVCRGGGRVTASSVACPTVYDEWGMIAGMFCAFERPIDPGRTVPAQACGTYCR
jgi:hypothetical protein